MTQQITYDDTEWHTEDEDFPDDLDARAAHTHIGMFLAWAIERNLESELLRATSKPQLEDLRAGKLKGSDILKRCCDSMLTDLQFSDLGNAFAQDYYEDHYLDDYVDLSDDDLPSIYHEPDTAEKYAEVRDMLDARFGKWKREKGID